MEGLLERREEKIAYARLQDLEAGHRLRIVDLDQREVVLDIVGRTEAGSVLANIERESGEPELVRLDSSEIVMGRPGKQVRVDFEVIGTGLKPRLVNLSRGEAVDIGQVYGLAISAR